MSVLFPRPTRSSSAYVKSIKSCTIPFALQAAMSLVSLKNTMTSKLSFRDGRMYTSCNGHRPLKRCLILLHTMSRLRNLSLINLPARANSSSLGMLFILLLYIPRVTATHNLSVVCRENDMEAQFRECWRRRPAMKRRTGTAAAMSIEPATAVEARSFAVNGDRTTFGRSQPTNRVRRPSQTVFCSRSAFGRAAWFRKRARVCAGSHA